LKSANPAQLNSLQFSALSLFFLSLIEKNQSPVLNLDTAELAINEKTINSAMFALRVLARLVIFLVSSFISLPDCFESI